MTNAVKEDLCQSCGTGTTESIVRQLDRHVFAFCTGIRVSNVFAYRPHCDGRHTPRWIGAETTQRRPEQQLTESPCVVIGLGELV